MQANMPADIQAEHEDLATADDVLSLCNELIGQFAHGPVLMPIVVLEGEDAVNRLVEKLHSIYKRARVRCRRYPNALEKKYAPPVPESPLPGLGPTLAEYGEALTLVRALAMPAGWDNADRSPYRPFSFPRSALLSAIEEAVAASGPDQRAAFRRLTRLRPVRPLHGSLAALRSLMTVLMPVVGIVLSVELTTLSTPQRAPLVLLLTGLAVLAGWGVLVFRQALTAPLSGFFPGSHWFATSTFILANDELGDDPPPRWGRLATLLPRSSRRVRAAREERARTIISQLAVAYYESPGPDPERERAVRLYLSIRVHALLEDLRANYRPWALDLRRRKRKWPPMLFLPDLDKEAGCVRFLQAVSDLRSRRSETDPLLILAGSRLPLRPDRGPEPANSGPSAYKRWIGKLRVEQSPSFGDHLPWVLRQTVSPDRADWHWPSAGRDGLPRGGWTVWRLWSRWTVALAVVLLGIAGVYRDRVIAGEYCGGWLFSHDPRLVLVNGECVGTDTTSVTAFLPDGPGVALSGAAAGLSQVNLARLENLIDTQNQAATTSGPYVTFVFAGALTDAGGSPDDPLNAIEQMAGVYAWQYYVNVMQDNDVKIRIDIANDGDGSAQEQRMAQTVVAAADQDPSIVGVIGLGVDTPLSGPAIKDFADAGLPVIDTTNSDDSFPRDYWNYFGLSPTNAEEAQALVTRYAHRGAGQHAVVLERVGTDGQASADTYSQQQAQSAETDLARAGFTLVGENGDPGPVTYTADTNLASPGIAQAVCAGHPSVVYLAGRNSDLKNLVGLLGQYRGCFPAAVTVLSGDDMAVTEFPGNHARALAPGMTLHYVAQTDPDHVPPAAGGGAGSADNGSGLDVDLQAALGLSGTLRYSDPVLANGLIALGFDAAHLLYNASTTNAGAGNQDQALPRDVVAPGLRCPQEPVSNGATGPLGFADVRHGLDFFTAVNATGPNPQRVTFQAPHQPTIPGKCAPNVAT